MTIRKEKHPSPQPAPPPPAKYNDQGSRRYRLEVIQVVHIDIDVTAGPHPHDQDEQVVRRIAADLLNEYRRNPEGWQARFERCFPEVVDRPTVSLGEITDVGPGAQMDANQRDVIEALEAAGAELPPVVPKQLDLAIPVKAEIVDTKALYRIRHEELPEYQKEILADIEAAERADNLDFDTETIVDGTGEVKGIVHVPVPGPAGGGDWIKGAHLSATSGNGDQVHVWTDMEKVVGVERPLDDVIDVEIVDDPQWIEESPAAECSECGRQTWGDANLGGRCLMVQPNGFRCKGRWIKVPLPEASDETVQDQGNQGTSPSDS